MTKAASKYQSPPSRSGVRTRVAVQGYNTERDIAALLDSPALAR